MVLGFIFGWKWKIRRLRKRWDRLRERSLKKDEPLRGKLLQDLDTIEQDLRTLEEQANSLHLCPSPKYPTDEKHFLFRLQPDSCCVADRFLRPD